MNLKPSTARKYPGFITGKPVGMGGSLGRTEATGFGVVYTLREACENSGSKPEKTIASVQGFGNVSQYAIRLYQQLGGKVICVSSWDQNDQTSYAFKKPPGSIVDALLGITDRFGGIHKDKARKLGYEILPGGAWLEQDVDILIPAALENQITAENVPKSRQGARSSPKAPTARPRPKPMPFSRNAASS